MDPGQASTQDQSVQALMIQLCELKKCVGTVQWAEPPSTLRQKILTRIGCEHKGLSCIHTRLGGYRVYGLNPELWAIPSLPPLPFFFNVFPVFFSSKIAFRKCISFPRFQLSNRCPAFSKYADSSRCPAGTFPPIAQLINTLSNDSAHLRLPRSPLSTLCPACHRHTRTSKPPTAPLLFGANKSN